MNLPRALVHLILFVAFAFLLGLFGSASPGVRALASVLQIGYGFPFAIVAACVLNRQPTLLLMFGGILLLLAWPVRTDEIERSCLPLALGFAAGLLGRRLMTEAAAATPQQPPHVMPMPERRNTNAPNQSDDWPDESLPGTERPDARRARRAPIRDTNRSYGQGRY